MNPTQDTDELIAEIEAEGFKKWTFSHLGDGYDATVLRDRQIFTAYRKASIQEAVRDAVQQARTAPAPAVGVEPGGRG